MLRNPATVGGAPGAPLAAGAAGFAGVRSWRDLAGHERVTEGALPREALESAPPMEGYR